MARAPNADWEARGGGPAPERAHPPQREPALHFAALPQMDPAALAAGLVFGAIGFIAFRYGRRLERISPTVIGLALMAYPIFLTSALWVTLVGLALTAALWVFRE